MRIFVDSEVIELSQQSQQITFLQLCAYAGIYVPRFCYHDDLPIAANCRMCLVQIEDNLKPIASCAVSVFEGAKISTISSIVRQARESVLEFLLINHPLDCPICDQGGECDLQDQAIVFGSDHGRFYEAKRAVSDFDLGPIIKTQMTRCIHCTRCVRFLKNLSMTSELGTIGRGKDMKITTFLADRVLPNNLSGNLADICPVGALTSKPYAFVARPWELVSYQSIDLYDAFGSNIRVDIRGSEVLRILPSFNKELNYGWITDKARYSFEGLAKQRLFTNLLVTEPVTSFIGGQFSYKVSNSKSLFFFTKLFFSFAASARLSIIVNPFAQQIKLNFGSIIDFSALAAIKTLVTFFKNFSILTSLNEQLSSIQISGISDFKANFLCDRQLKSSTSALAAIKLIACDLEKENPLFQLIFLKSIVENSKPGSVHVNYSVKLMRPFFKSAGISFFNLFNNTLLFSSKSHSFTLALMGQSVISRSDSGSFGKIIQPQPSKDGYLARFCLIASDSFLPNFLELAVA